MMRAAASISLFLVGCGPVLIGDQTSNEDAGSDAAVPVGVVINVQPTNCGSCFQVSAMGFGGQGPYQFEWEDQSTDAERNVCIDSAAGPLELKVTARDATAARSSEYVTRLQPDAAAGCPAPQPVPVPPALCFKNPSFEGTPAANFGQPNSFDAAPWSACTNPAVGNTPDVANDTIEQMFAAVPKPTDGVTYLALGEDEQVSQTLCETVPGGSDLHLALDLSRLNLGEGVVPETEAVFLEIWGGIASDCSQRELLWASTPLKVGWERQCVFLKPRQYMDQITLRANSDKTLPLSPAYLLVDHLESLSECP